MRNYLFLFLVLFMPAIIVAQEINENYDDELARSFEADDYGMKSYTFVILKTGQYEETDSTKRAELFAGHLKNIGRLADEGKIVVAGPIGQNANEYRGLFVFDVADKDEVKKLLQTDPVIKAGILDYDLYSWYGSAALKAYLEVHEKVSKYQF